MYVSQKSTFKSSRSTFHKLIYIDIKFSSLVRFVPGDCFKKSFTVLVLEKYNVIIILHEYALRKRTPQGTKNRLKCNSCQFENLWEWQFQMCIFTVES